MKAILAAAAIPLCTLSSPVLAQEAITSCRSVTLAFANELAAETVKALQSQRLQDRRDSR
jgi:hypothetical protein